MQNLARPPHTFASEWRRKLLVHLSYSILMYNKGRQSVYSHTQHHDNFTKTTIMLTPDSRTPLNTRKHRSLPNPAHTRRNSLYTTSPTRAQRAVDDAPSNITPIPTLYSTCGTASRYSAKQCGPGEYTRSILRSVQNPATRQLDKMDQLSLTLSQKSIEHLPFSSS